MWPQPGNRFVPFLQSMWKKILWITLYANAFGFRIAHVLISLYVWLFVCAFCFFSYFFFVRCFIVLFECCGFDCLFFLHCWLWLKFLIDFDPGLGFYAKSCTGYTPPYGFEKFEWESLSCFHFFLFVSLFMLFNTI